MAFKIKDPFTGLYVDSVNYSTNRISGFVIEGTCDAGANEIMITDDRGTIYSSLNPGSGVTKTSTTWTFEPVLQPGENIYSAVQQIVGNIPSPAGVITITNADDSTLLLEVSPPTGLRVERKRDHVVLSCIENPEPEVRGYNVYGSIEAAGGTNGYVRLNKSLITTPAFYEERKQSSEVVLSETEDPQTGNITRVTERTEYVIRDQYFSFPHDRTATDTDTNYPAINNTDFGTIPTTQLAYYVFTAVGYDATNRIEVESVYSSEISATPFIVDTTIRDIIPVKQSDIARRFIELMQRTQGALSLNPGAVTRDVHIDPPSVEFEQAYFLMDFDHRSQSFLTLLEVDDADGDRESDSLATSPYKQALQLATGLATEAEVQQLIDDAFTKLAGNFDKTRKGAERAFGRVVFYANAKPKKTIEVPTGSVVSTSGSPSVQFETTASLSVAVEDVDSYYNLNNGRYEFPVSIRAVSAGASGNQVAGAINNVVSGASAGLRCINTEATIFGQDIENNASLAERAMLAFDGVDTGTASGYLSTTLAQPGVVRAKVISAGEDLMQRDYDEVRNKHIGGKVDVYVQGSNEQTVTDTFAYRFEELNAAKLGVADASTLTFTVDEPEITEATPVFSVVSMTNVSGGNLPFSLTAAQLIDYRTVKLSLTANPTQVVFPNSIIAGTFRYRSSDRYSFKKQPVRQVQSVVGSEAGALPSNAYSIFQSEDPLILGNSTLASDSLQINPVGGVPSGEPQTVTNESHVMTGSDKIKLEKVGVRPSTIVVKNLAQNVTYLSDIVSITPDYFVEDGGLTDTTTIQRNTTGNIVNGQEVLVSYQHEENFTVSYTINQLLQDIQTKLNEKRHVTADVIVKEAVVNPLDIECTVILKKNAEQADVDSQIRTNVSRLVNSSSIGQNIYQEDIISQIGKVPGVEYVVVPFAKMVKGDGSKILREALDNANLEVDSGTVRIFLLTESLEFATIDGGGLTTQHRGVFQDEIAMELVSTYSQLSVAPGRAFIIGKAGIPISGYTDLPENAGKQAELTGNRIAISLPADQTPLTHKYTVSYIVNGETGAKDITVASMESLTVGKFTITYSKAK